MNSLQINSASAGTLLGKSYIYDYKGNVSLVSNTVGSTFGVENSVFHRCDGLNVSDCQDSCREEEGSGSPYPRNACECSNNLFYAVLGLGIDCNLSRILYYYHPYYLGHNGYITDITGRPYPYFHYSAFGESLIEKNTNYGQFSSPYRFNAKELDPETGNYYYGARYYDPQTSIWLSPDPLRGNNPHLTPYNFMSNNPVMRIDPTGMDDGWVEGEDGNITYDADVHSQQDLKDQGKSGTYKGEEGTGFNSETGNQVYYGSNGESFEYSQMVSDATVDGGQMSDHARSVKAGKELGIYSAQSNFISGSFHLGTELLDKTGKGVSYVGYGLTLTGVGAEIGIPLAAFGNGVSTAADVLKFSSQVANRDIKGGAESVGFYLLGEAVQLGVNRISGGGLGKEILKQGANIKVGIAKDIYDYNQSR